MLALFPRRAISSEAAAAMLLPGGFGKRSLQEWCKLTDFGTRAPADDSSRDMRRRRRLISSGPDDQYYVDMFESKIPQTTKVFLTGQQNPSDAIARAFFRCARFTPERLFLLSINQVFSNFPNEAKKLPTVFEIDTKYLHWRVASRTPLELICAWRLRSIKGVTQFGFDPSVNKIYHGNCINLDESNHGLLANLCIYAHVQYAKWLVEGMVKELNREALRSY